MPYIHNRYARRIDADTLDILLPDGSQSFRLHTPSAGITHLMTHDGQLFIQPSITVADYPKIRLRNAQNIELYLKAAMDFKIFEEITEFLAIDYAGSVPTITAVQTNTDVMLIPNGTGRVRFGTKTGTGDVAVDGYVATKDAAGGAVKLATVA